jgi:septation ring formation regulator EzrA
VNAVPNPVDPPQPPPLPSVSAAADRARAELHEEIERVRRGVEEVLAEQGEPLDGEFRRELDDLREDTRLYVKKRIKRSEKRTDRSIEKLAKRTEGLEQRLDQLDAERRMAEYRIHSDTEQMLDGLLGEVRAVADRLEGKG